MLVMKKSFLTVCTASQHRSHCFLSSMLTDSPAANHLCCPLTNLEVIKTKILLLTLCMDILLPYVLCALQSPAAKTDTQSFSLNYFN